MWLLYKSDLLRYRNIRGNCKNSTLFIFEKKRYIYLSIHLVCMFLLIQKNVKTAEPIGPKFCVGPHVTPGKGYEWSNPQTFFVFVLYCTTRRCSEINRQLKVKIGDGREAPYNPSFINLKDFLKINFYESEKYSELPFSVQCLYNHEPVWREELDREPQLDTVYSNPS